MPNICSGSKSTLWLSDIFLGKEGKEKNYFFLDNRRFYFITEQLAEEEANISLSDTLFVVVSLEAGS